KELREALDLIEQLPAGKVFLVPARLEPCEVSHPELGELTWVDLFPSWDDGIRRLERTIKLSGRGFSSVPRRRSSRPHRVQRDFSDDAYKRLKMLQRESDTRTSAELLRQALRVIDWLMRRRREGWHLQLASDDGRVLLVDLVLGEPTVEPRPWLNSSNE